MNRKPTTIKSHFGKRITISENADGVHLACSADESGEGGHLRIYKRADLHKALGIDELGCGCDDADDNLKAAIARAEAAEAAIERVRAVRNEWSKTLGRTGIVIAIDDALNPPAPFTLPTEAGARFTATHHSGSLTTFVTVTNGTETFYLPTSYDTMTLWCATDVLTEFTNHRLTGTTK